MNRWIVVLADDQQSEALALRKHHFGEHFEFLRSNFDKIVFSCGIKDTTDNAEPPHGGLWVVEAETKGDVIQLLEQDPYFRLGLRGRIDVYKAHEGYI